MNGGFGEQNRLSTVAAIVPCSKTSFSTNPIGVNGEITSAGTRGPSFPLFWPSNGVAFAGGSM